MSKIIMIIFLHILGDSVLLGQKLRKQKIDNIFYLFKHIGIYSLVFIIFTPVLLNISIITALYYCLINAVLHFIVDFYFTKIKKIFWDKGDYKYVASFSIAEHVLHISILLTTYFIMFPGSIDIQSWYNDFIIHVLRS